MSVNFNCTFTILWYIHDYLQCVDSLFLNTIIIKKLFKNDIYILDKKISDFQY